MDSEENAVGQELEAQPEQEAVVSEVASIETQAPEESTADEEKKEQARPSSLDDLKPGMRMKGKIRNIVDFGAFVDIGVGRDGLAHISTLKRAGIDQTLKVGDVIDVQVRRVDLDNNRISLTVPGAGKNAKTSLRELKEGAIVSGRVVRLVDFGAFVDIDAQTDGLLHISQLRSGFVSHPSEVVKVGDEVQVRILEVDQAKRRISLTMKDTGVEEEKGYSPAPTTPDPDMPTAFQVAWEQALADRKRGSRSAS